MKKLPAIYKNVVNTHNNLETFYSKEEEKQEKTILKIQPASQKNVKSKIEEIFKNKSYSYTKKLKVTVQGKTFETRFISEKEGEILTIDNEIISLKDIEEIEELS